LEISTVYKKKYHVGISDVDFTRKIKLSSLFNYFQDIASMAAEKLGYGIDILASKYNVIWALIRIKVDIIRDPVWNEDIFIETWPQAPKRFEYERDYIVRDKDGNIIINATSVWVIIDIESRQLKSSETVDIKYPSIKTERAIDERLRRLKATGNMQEAYKKVIGYSDIDINEHLNNSKYTDFIMDCFTIEDLKQCKVKSIEVNYVNETLPGETIILYKDTSTISTGIICIEGVKEKDKDKQTVFRARLEIAQIP
jgi:acyl-ACP thioesterase